MQRKNNADVSKPRHWSVHLW